MIYNYNRRRNTNPLLLDILKEWLKLAAFALLVFAVLLVIGLLARQVYIESAPLIHTYTNAY